MPLRHGLSKLSRSPSAMWLERVLYSLSKVFRSPFKVATALIERWAVGEDWNLGFWFTVAVFWPQGNYTISSEHVWSWETSGQWGLWDNCAANLPQGIESWHSSKGHSPRVCKRHLWTCWPDTNIHKSEAEINIYRKNKGWVGEKIE